MERHVVNQKASTVSQKEQRSELARKPWALINLPPFPAVAARILQLLSKEDAGMKELAALIRSDVAFSSEVLTMANSALFTFRNEITGILQATVLLGLQRVKAVALTVGMRSYLLNSLEIPGVLAPQPGLRSGLRGARKPLPDRAGHCLSCGINARRRQACLDRGGTAPVQ